MQFKYRIKSDVGGSDIFRTGYSARIGKQTHYVVEGNKGGWCGYPYGDDRKKPVASDEEVTCDYCLRTYKRMIADNLVILSTSNI